MELVSLFGLICGVWFSYAFVTLAIFYAFRTHPMICKRTPSLVVVGAICGMLSSLDSYLGGMTCLYMQVLRCIVMIHDYHDQILHVAQNAIARQTLSLTAANRFVFAMQRFFRGRNFRAHSDSSIDGEGQIIPLATTGIAVSPTRSTSSSPSRSTAGIVPAKPMASVALHPTNPSISSRTNSIMRLAKMDTRQIIGAGIFVVLLAQVFSVLISLFLMSCMQDGGSLVCDSVTATWYIIYAWVGLYMFTMPFCLGFLRTIPDSFGIRSELTFNLLFFELGFLIYILGYYCDAVSGLMARNGLTPEMSLFMVVFGVHHASVIIPVVVAQWRGGDGGDGGMCPGKVGSATSGLVGFEAVLADPVLFARFKHSAAQDFALENVRFYEEYTLLAASLPTAHSAPPHLVTSICPGTRPTPAILYLLFVRTGSVHELNLPDHIRREATKHYAAEGEAFDIRALAPIREEVMSMMHRALYPRFLDRMAKADQ